MHSLFSRKKQKGQGLVEYALVLVLVSVVAIVVMTSLGGKVSDVFRYVNEAISSTPASETGNLQTGTWLAEYCGSFDPGTTLYGTDASDWGDSQIESDLYQYTCS